MAFLFLDKIYGVTERAVETGQHAKSLSWHEPGAGVEDIPAWERGSPDFKEDTPQLLKLLL